MKYNRLMRLTPTASNPLPTSNLFTCTYSEIFRVRYRTGFPAAEVTGHNTKYRIANYPMGEGVQDTTRGFTATFSVHDDKPLEYLNKIFFGQ